MATSRYIGIDETKALAYSDEGEGIFEWRIHVAQPKKLFGKRPGGAAADQIQQRVRQTLENAGVTVTVEEE